jgi:putative ABC transport system permease protein
MVLRDVARRPARAALSALGLAFAIGILVVARFAGDAIDRVFLRVMVEAQRQDATVTFTHALADDVAVELRALQGVRRVEPFRAVPAVLRSGHRTHRAALVGVDRDAALTRLVDADGAVVPVPPSGVVLSRKLAELLAVRPGDALDAEVLEGRRPILRLPVAATVEDYVGVQATVARPHLGALLGDGALASGAHLAIDPGALPEVQAELRARPNVAGLTLRAATVAAFRALIAEFLGIYLGVVIVLALAIAAGVVYSSARVTYSERERELATLRVIGFTRGEAWRLVAGEIALHVVAAVPAGWLVAFAFVAYTASTASTDLYRLPTTITRPTFATAALIVAGASALVTLVVRRWIRRLDLVEVLKSRE